MIFLLIVAMIFFATLASVYLKKAAQESEGFSILLHPLMIFGLVFYGVSGIATIFALRISDLSFVFPFGALTYLFISLISFTYFKEPVTKTKIFGLSCIILGVLLIGLS